MRLVRTLTLATALVGVATLAAYAQSTRSAAFPWQDQAGALELLRWNEWGCTTDTDCERMESWIRNRYHFDQEGGV